MNRPTMSYWLFTGLFSLSMGAAGVLNLVRFEGQQTSMVSLGNPIYLMSILGVAKVLGVIALLIPKAPLLKEWAYAGFTFNLFGASASHAFAGHAPPEIIVPLALFALAVASYKTRPPERCIAK
ncbi:MAG: DoxX family protein [Planctomycetota bacterium]